MTTSVSPVQAECDRCGTWGWCYPIDGLTTQERGKPKRAFLSCCQPNQGQRWLPSKRKVDEPKTTAEPTEEDVIQMLED